MTPPHVVILGAGPAGLGAAYALARRGEVQVSVLERSDRAGGNAGSFDLAGFRVDYGSHRLHPACDPVVLKDIRELLGGDLLDRPRHGRIRLRGRWIHFPLRPLDLALRLPPGFLLGVAGDMVRRLLPAKSTSPAPETFASVLRAGLGDTICRDFYFPYGLKIWGLPPEALSAAQARRRVAAGSPAKMLRKVLSAVPGLRPPSGGRFFYPKQGYGQIAEAYGQAAGAAGARLHFNAQVTAVEVQANGPITVHYEQGGQSHSLAAGHVWSTLPIPALARGLRPQPPAELLRAAERIGYRAMILVYLVVEQERFSDFDAHYFPERAIPITRLSEPKNYNGGHGPQGLTVLCAELPCDPADPVWSQEEAALGRLVQAALETAGIPLRAPVRQVAVRRLRQAYPIYQRGYEAYFDALDEWIGRIDGLLTFGRQGLFAHDNTHHALFMAYAAADCLDAQGRFDRARWQDYRRVFATHVVED